MYGGKATIHDIKLIIRIGQISQPAVYLTLYAVAPRVDVSTSYM